MRNIQLQEIEKLRLLLENKIKEITKESVESFVDVKVQISLYNIDVSDDIWSEIESFTAQSTDYFYFHNNVSSSINIYSKDF